MTFSIRIFRQLLYNLALCGFLTIGGHSIGYADDQRFDDLLARLNASESFRDQLNLCIDALKSGYLSRAEVGKTYETMGRIYFEMYWAYDRQLEQKGYDSSERINRLGSILEDSIRSYNIALEIDPAVVKSHWSRGLSYEKLGFYEKALSNFDEAIRLAPEVPELYLYRARLRKHLGDLDGAEKDRNEAMRLEN